MPPDSDVGVGRALSRLWAVYGPLEDGSMAWSLDVGRGSLAIVANRPYHAPVLVAPAGIAHTAREQRSTQIQLAEGITEIHLAQFLDSL